MKKRDSENKVISIPSTIIIDYLSICKLKRKMGKSWHNWMVTKIENVLLFHNFRMSVTYEKYKQESYSVCDFFNFYYAFEYEKIKNYL